MKFAFTLEAGHHIALLLIKSILIAQDPAKHCECATSKHVQTNPPRYNSLPKLIYRGSEFHDL